MQQLICPLKRFLSCLSFPLFSCYVAILHNCSDAVHIQEPAAHPCRKVPFVVPVLNHYFLWVHRQPVFSVHSVHSLVLLSQEQVPSLHIQHLPDRLRFTLQQKMASAAQ